MCAQAFFLLPLFALLLRWFGIRRSHTFLSRLLISNQPHCLNKDQILGQAHDIARMVEIAAGRYPFRIANCLPQSLTVWWLLCCCGIDSELRIGVRKEADRLKAHAWVEYEGYVLNDAAGNCSRFLPFQRPLITRKVSSL